MPNGSTYISHLSVESSKETHRLAHFKQAQSAAVDRRSKASRIPRKLTPEMISLATDGLKKYWSPQQICGRLLLEGGPLISHESIYKLIWKNKRENGILWTYLRHKGKKYHKRKGKTSGRGLIPNRVDIEERPKIVEMKARIGDWEGDTIEGAGHKGAIL